MTTGAPKSDVTALIGKVYSLVGSWAIMSQTNKITAPNSPTAGINIL